MRLLVAILGLCGCAAKMDDRSMQREYPKLIPVVGDPADFKTRPGHSDGYDVVECWDHSCAGIVGTGQNWAPGMQQEPGTSAAIYNASFQRFRADLTAELASSARSIDTSGVSRRCGVGLAETVFWLHSWRDLDPALISAGHFLKVRDLKERISFCVQAYAQSVEE